MMIKAMMEARILRLEADVSSVYLSYQVMVNLSEFHERINLK